MMLKYIGSPDLMIHNYGIIKTGDIIEREDLCNSFKDRADFVEIKSEKVKKVKAGEDPKPKRKYGRKRSK